MANQEKSEPLKCIYEITSDNPKAITDFAEFLLEMIQNSDTIHGETVSSAAFYDGGMAMVMLSTKSVIGEYQAWRRLVKTFDPALQLTCRYIKITKRQYIVIHEKMPQEKDRADWTLVKVRSDSGIDKEVRHAYALELLKHARNDFNYLHQKINKDKAEDEWMYFPLLSPAVADDMLKLDIIMPVTCIAERTEEKEQTKNDE